MTFQDYSQFQARSSSLIKDMVIRVAVEFVHDTTEYWVESYGTYLTLTFIAHHGGARCPHVGHLSLGKLDHHSFPAQARAKIGSSKVDTPYAVYLATSVRKLLSARFSINRNHGCRSCFRPCLPLLHCQDGQYFPEVLFNRSCMNKWPSAVIQSTGSPSSVLNFAREYDTVH